MYICMDAPTMENVPLYWEFKTYIEVLLGLFFLHGVGTEDYESDYRALNRETYHERQLSPRVQDILNGLGGNKWFTRWKCVSCWLLFGHGGNGSSSEVEKKRGQTLWERSARYWVFCATTDSTLQIFTHRQTALYGLMAVSQSTNKSSK